jgi:phosphodiesterase/alkaline phosphatase D-like protein
MRFEYGPSPSLGSIATAAPALVSGEASVPESAELRYLEPNLTYYYRLSGADADGRFYGGVESFTTPAVAPTLIDESTSGVTQTSAILNARVNPNNEDTHGQFQLGTSAAYGTSFPSTDLGSSYGAVGVGRLLTGLRPGTTYHFRVLATSEASPPGGIVGPDQTFTTLPPTPPLVETGAATGVTQNAASVSGTVDPRGAGTTYEFDVGADTSYGSRVFGTAGSGSGPAAVTAGLQGLAPGTTYHYRLVAASSFGTTYGADQTFTTPVFAGSALGAPPLSALVQSRPRSPPPAASARGEAPTRAQQLRRESVGRNRGPAAALREAARNRYAATRREAIMRTGRLGPALRRARGSVLTAWPFSACSCCGASPPRRDRASPARPGRGIRLVLACDRRGRGSGQQR